MIVKILMLWELLKRFGRHIKVKSKVLCGTFFIPRVIKRQILLATLYLKGRNEKVFKNINMAELNDCLQIANDHEMLDKLVVMSNGGRWYNFEFKNLLQKYECNLDERVDGNIINQLSMDIAKSTPCWLNYGSNNMAQDIGGLLTRVPIANN